MNNLQIQYNSEQEDIMFPEYGRSVQQLIQHCTTITNDAKRQKTAEAIINIMLQLIPVSAKNLQDDLRERVWNHAFRIAKYEWDVKPTPGITIRHESERPKPEKVSYVGADTRFRHYGLNVQRLIEKAIQMPDGPKKESFVEVIASYMKLAYKTWNREHYVSDDVVKTDLERLSDGKIIMHENYSSLDTLAAGANRKEMGRTGSNQRVGGQGRPGAKSTGGGQGVNRGGGTNSNNRGGSRTGGGYSNYNNNGGNNGPNRRKKS